MVKPDVARYAKKKGTLQLVTKKVSPFNGLTFRSNQRNVFQKPK